MIGLLLSAVASANAQSPVPVGAKTVVSENVMYIIATVLALELLLIFYLAFAIRSFLKKESAALEAQPVEAVKKEKISWFDRLYNRNTQEDIIKLDMGHDYDGIKELDNDIPIWWKYGFAFCILFGVVYLYSYHVTGTRPLQQKELQIDQEIAAVKQAAYLEKAANNIDENSVKMLGLSDIEAGKALFIKPGACATCHAENGSAIVNGAPGIGPNLTDEYWIHKGDIKSIFKTIKYGVVEKGMKSWKDDYSPLQMAQLSSYIKSLQGTNPSPAKEKQGELFKDETTPAATVDSSSKAVKM
jgi:cytochrome c oxidase cbb3-type subunit 3